MSFFSKIIILSLIFSSCVRQEQTGVDSSSTSALSDNPSKSMWRSQASFPLTIKYGKDFDTDEISAIETSTGNWTDSVQNEIQFFDVKPSDLNKKNTLSSYEDSELGIYKLNSWPTELPPTALAVTQIFGSRINSGKSSEYVEIEHADILMNYENFSFTTDNTWGYDLETVLIHELGHFLGLYHDDVSIDDSVMYPTVSRYNDNKYPKQKDIDNILNKYSISKASSQNSALAENSSLDAQRVVLILELYPDGSEIIKIKKGDKYESINHSCTKH